METKLGLGARGEGRREKKRGEQDRWAQCWDKNERLSPMNWLEDTKGGKSKTGLMRNTPDYGSRLARVWPVLVRTEYEVSSTNTLDSGGRTGGPNTKGSSFPPM